ncbi:glycosyltransferase [bacterium]|nr:glycosyltransferase [bacterium]
MRIVFVLPVGIERPSGIRYFNIARELVRQGHSVRVLALHPDLAHCPARRFVQEDVEVWYLGQMHSLKRGNQAQHFGLFALLRVLLLSTLGLIWGILRSPADVYHVCKAQPVNGLAACVGISLLRGRRFFLDCDDDETHSNRLSPTQRKVFAFWEWLLMKLAVGGTVNTRFLERRCRAAGMDRVVYVPNGVDGQRFLAPSAWVTWVTGLRRALRIDDSRVVAYFGSIAFQNHPVDLLMDAFALVQRRAADARLLVIGAGEDLPMLDDQAKRLGIGDAVRLIGYLPQQALPPFLALADVSVDPVHDDSVAQARSPLKLFESMAMGVAVVTADVGDRAEWLDHGAAGVLVAPGDAAALADAICALLDDPAQRRQLADRAGLRAATHYSWSTLAAQWLRVYTKPTAGSEGR